MAVLLAAIGGGLLALFYQLRAGGPMANQASAFLVGVPGLERWAKTNSGPEGMAAPVTVPYAVGIALGSLLALAVYWCSGSESWLL